MPPTALMKHVYAVYDLMEERSELDAVGRRVFTGSFVKLLEEAGVSNTYYSPVRSVLMSPDIDPCITILEKGSRYRGTAVELRHRPPESWADQISHRDLTAPRATATIVAELERKVESLIAWRETTGGINLGEALRTFEKRLSKVERELQLLKDSQAPAITQQREENGKTT